MLIPADGWYAELRRDPQPDDRVFVSEDGSVTTGHFPNGIPHTMHFLPVAAFADGNNERPGPYTALLPGTHDFPLLDARDVENFVRLWHVTDLRFRFPKVAW